MQATARSPGPLRHFGSSGIRGPLDKVDVALGLRLGRALGATHPRVIVGRDARRTGPALEAALIAGLTASGAHVTRAGMVPTPALARATADHDLGVQVTASHNPSPDNGYKLWTPTGSAPPEATLHQIEASMAQPPDAATWDQTGPVRDDPGVLTRYMDAVRAHVDPDRTQPLADIRIALDCAHGAGALATPRILSDLGAELTVLGGSPDGRFPDHPSEPTAEHLGRLSRTVSDGAHAFGLAHDGDADRTILLAPDGQVIAPERLFAVLAAERGDTHVALPIDASGVVTDHLPDIHITTTPVGDIHLSRAIDAGATFACEPSGTWFFAEWSPTPEGPFAAVHIAVALAQRPRLLDQIAALPTYARRTIKLPLPDGLDHPATSARIDALADHLTDALGGEPSNVDGVRIQTNDGWVLLRPSGTEPVVRITAEAQTQHRADRLAETAREAFEAVPEGR